MGYVLHDRIRTMRLSNLERRSIRIVNGISMLAALALTAGSALADEFEPASRIDAVVIHPDGALVTRAIDFQVPAGRHTLVLQNLPPGVQPASIQIDPGMHADIPQFRVNTHYVPGEPKPVFDRNNHASFEALTKEREELQGRIEALEDRKAAIKRHPTDAGSLDPTSWVTAWDLIEQGIVKANEALRPLRARTAELDAKIAAIIAARSKFPLSSAPRLEVAVAVDAREAVSGTFRLIYRVRGAHWKPRYDARLQTDEISGKSPLTLTRQALIIQCTNEPWTDVKLSLATHAMDQELVALRPPSLRAILSSAPSEKGDEDRLDAVNDTSGCTQISPVLESSSGEHDDKATAAVAADAMVRKHSAIFGNDSNETFTLEDRISIPHDGSITTAIISSETVSPATVLVTTPEFDQKAYAETTFKLSDGRPLQAGEIFLYRNDVPVGRGQLGFSLAGKEIKLGFGPDDRVRVKRIPHDRRDTEARMLGSSKVELREVRTIVTNLHRGPLQVRVIDRVPTTENNAIQIEPDFGSMPPTEPGSSERPGVVAWTLDLPAGAEKEFRFGYTLKWPADQQLDLGQSGEPASRSYHQ